MDFIRSPEEDQANKSWSLYTTKKVSLFFQSIDSFLWYKEPFLSAHVLFSVWEFYACPYHLLQKMSGCKAKFVAFLQEGQ